eukprot:1157509-Pelagomonas_calceolata.AAC.11
MKRFKEQCGSTPTLMQGCKAEIMHCPETHRGDLHRGRYALPHGAVRHHSHTDAGLQCRDHARLE